MATSTPVNHPDLGSFWFASPGSRGVAPHLLFQPQMESKWPIHNRCCHIHVWLCYDVCRAAIGSESNCHVLLFCRQVLINQTWWVVRAAAGPETPMWHDKHTCKPVLCLFHGFECACVFNLCTLCYTSAYLPTCAKQLTGQVASWNRKCTSADWQLLFPHPVIKTATKHTLDKKKKRKALSCAHLHDTR